MRDPQTEETLAEFERLAQLQSELRRLLDHGAASLEPFYAPASGGFAHLLAPGGGVPKRWSKSSTATCLAFLRATGQLQSKPWGETNARLRHDIVVSDWDTADLGTDNAFTVAFLLEALADLGGRKALSADDRLIVNRKLRLLRRTLGAGGIGLDGYHATAFLTYKAVCALRRWDGSLKGERAEEWNWNHLYKESALVASGSADADVFEVAYSVLIANAIRPLDEMTPQQRSLLRFGLGQFFSAQRDDGGWPRSRPLFVYPKLGHAFCFEYELLGAMLAEPQLIRELHSYLPALRRAAGALELKRYPFEPRDGRRGAYGWASGHHGADPSPESWSTAAALQFCFGLSELIAESIRAATFAYADASYERPRDRPARPPYLPAAKFLDSAVPHGGRAHSLSGILEARLIKPLVAGSGALLEGRPLGPRIPTSAIFYGPPGTSKTELAKLVAKALGWPLLALDPSHLTRRGLDNVHAEANTIFRMLEQCERIVVLLDEFDELMRERERSDALESRFLTTAMLPKLAALSAERRLVYLVATNHLEQFDAAIRRPGRFALVLPVMPPTTAAKLKRWPALRDAERRIAAGGSSARAKARAEIGDLTFLEAKELAERLKGVSSVAELTERLERAAQDCTLRQQVSPPASDGTGEVTWKEQIEEQRGRIRGVDA